MTVRQGLREKGTMEKKHTSRSYEQELQEVKEGLLQSAALVEEAIGKALKALIDGDTELALAVISDDQRVNEIDVAVEERCIRLLALRQPAATDLRFIATAIKVNGHLERIGDMAVNIAERVILLNDLPRIKPYVDIPRMADIARKMIRDSLDALVRQDIELANRVREEDEKVDQLEDQITRELITFMMEDPRRIHPALLIMQVAKNLERISDHAEGIAKMVVFLITGRIIRHGRSIEQRSA